MLFFPARFFLFLPPSAMCVAPITCCTSGTLAEKQQMATMKAGTSAIDADLLQGEIITRTRRKHCSLNRPHEEERKQKE
jgi:hypothetical protein